MRYCLLIAILAVACMAGPAHAFSIVDTSDTTCTGRAYLSRTDYMFRKQSDFYLTAYRRGAMTMQAMGRRLAVYAHRYDGLEGQFARFMQARAGAGGDFTKPGTYVQALADFLASVEVDTHMNDMCNAARASKKKAAAV